MNIDNVVSEFVVAAFDKIQANPKGAYVICVKNVPADSVSVGAAVVGKLRELFPQREIVDHSTTQILHIDF